MNPAIPKRKTAALFVVLCSLASVAQSAKPQHARLSLISEQAPAGSSQWIALRFELDPGWHIYWTNPGDSGEPPRVTWQLPSGIQAGDLQFPPPRRIQDHGLTDFGYQGDVVLLSRLTVPAGGTSNEIKIAADVRYLVCREVCVPAKAQLSMTLPVNGSSTMTSQADLIRKAAARLPQPLPRGIYASATVEERSIHLTITGKTPNLGPIADFIPAEAAMIENSTKPLPRRSGNSTTIALRTSEQLNHPISELRGLLIAGDKAYTATIPVKPSGHGSVSPKSAPEKSAKKTKE